jgi:hypothetical protein
VALLNRDFEKLDSAQKSEKRELVGLETSHVEEESPNLCNNGASGTGTAPGWW